MPTQPTPGSENNFTPLLQGEELLLRKAHYLVRALDHKVRIDMILYLHKQKACTVTDIFMTFGLLQAVASQHLAVLRRAGLVTTKRKGKHIYYALNYNRLKHLLSLSNKLA